MKHFRKLHFLSLFLLCLTFGGCLKDDLSDCPPTHNVTLHYRYLYEGMGNDLFAARVGNVEVDVFGTDGQLVTSIRQDKPELDLFQGAKLLLEPGTYRIVCWGGIFEHTDIQKANGIDNALVLHTDRASQSSDSDDPMFYAPRIHDLSNPDADIFTITVPAQGSVEETIDFTAAHNTIEVLVKGFSGTPGIEVTELASAYNFNLQTLADKPMRFFQTAHNETREQTAYAVATFHTALFENDNPVNINILKPVTGDNLHSVNLKQFLTSNNITLHPTDWDKISILIEFNDLGVVVNVTQWDGTDITPGVE